MEALSRCIFRDDGMSAGLGREKFNGFGFSSLEAVENAPGVVAACMLSSSVSLTGLRRPKGMTTFAM